MWRRTLERWWIQRSPILLALLPLSLLFCVSVELRRLAYTSGILKQHRLPVPAIIIGNVTAGGTGKTPLVEWLAGFLVKAGYRPGLVARGYGGRAGSWPQLVHADSDPALVGDEPVMLVQSTGLPMAVGPDRVAAARALLAAHDCDIVVSDDGLQHYRLARDIEIAVIDGTRRFDNGFCLPAGPMRERRSRLNRADLVVASGSAGQGEHAMKTSLAGYAPVCAPDRLRPLEDFRGQTVHAIAGIANPARFFHDLRHAGIEIIAHAFPDHHSYAANDLAFGDDRPILMTRKDAVKCRKFATIRMYSVPCRAELDDEFATHLLSLIKPLKAAAENL